MKFNPMATNYNLLNMKPIILFYYSPFIHKSSIFYIVIQIYQYYKSLQQGGGEMPLFVYYWSIIHEIYWNLDMINLLIDISDNLNHNTKYWSNRSPLQEINSSPSAPHSTELKYGEKTWDARKKKPNLRCPRDSIYCTYNLWLHLISFKYLSGLSKHQLGWESLTLEIG